MKSFSRTLILQIESLLDVDKGKFVHKKISFWFSDSHKVLQKGCKQFVKCDANLAIRSQEGILESWL